MQVRMYDEATKTLQSTLSGGLGYQRVGHSNRVFSLKFCTENEHMLLSAGWDNTVQVLCFFFFVLSSSVRDEQVVEVEQWCCDKAAVLQ